MALILDIRKLSLLMRSATLGTRHYDYFKGRRPFLQALVYFGIYRHVHPIKNIGPL